LSLLEVPDGGETETEGTEVEATKHIARESAVLGATTPQRVGEIVGARNCNGHKSLFLMDLRVALEEARGV